MEIVIYSEKYTGVLVRFEVNPGTTQQLQQIGVRDTSNLAVQKVPDMPIGSSGWTKDNAYFKGEGKQINIGLGKGKGLDVFNENIVDHTVVQPPKK